MTILASGLEDRTCWAMAAPMIPPPIIKTSAAGVSCIAASFGALGSLGCGGQGRIIGCLLAFAECDPEVYGFDGSYRARDEPYQCPVVPSTDAEDVNDRTGQRCPDQEPNPVRAGENEPLSGGEQRRGRVTGGVDRSG